MNKVKGKENLFKDPNSGAIVNADQNAYKLAKQYKKRILSEREKQTSLEDRIATLESVIQQLISKSE